MMKKYKVINSVPSFIADPDVPVNDWTFENLDSEKVNQLDYVNLLKDCQNILNLSDSFISRAADCATYRDTVFNSDYSRSRLLRSNFCRERFCPTDMRIRSSALYQKVKACLFALPSDYKVIFVTLTVPSVKDADSLRKTCSKMSAAFCKITHLPLFENILGYYRSLEITYNQDEGFHPHYHILLVTHKDTVLNKFQFIIQWTARFLGVKEYKRRVVAALVENGAMSSKDAHRYVLDMLSGNAPYWARDYRFLARGGIHFIMDNFRENVSVKTAAYSCKYAFKGSDFLGNGAAVFCDFFRGASRLHLSAFGGCLRDLARAYDRGEIGDAKKGVSEIFTRRLMLVWRCGHYFCTKNNAFVASEWNRLKMPVTVDSWRENAFLNRSLTPVLREKAAADCLESFLRSGRLYWLCDSWNSLTNEDKAAIRSACVASLTSPPDWLVKGIKFANPFRE